MSLRFRPLPSLTDSQSGAGNLGSPLEALVGCPPFNSAFLPGTAVRRVLHIAQANTPGRSFSHKTNHHTNSDHFVFDNKMLALITYFGCSSSPTAEP
jgi:hypothetical protein